MKRWPILNAAAGTTGNCEALVPDQSSFGRSLSRGPLPNRY
jgi:hypothetical protein